jgi:hypothetical protein
MPIRMSIIISLTTSSVGEDVEKSESTLLLGM